MTIVEFLTARLDEEEAAWRGGLRLATKPEFSKLASHQLADVAAKRRIIAQYTEASKANNHDDPLEFWFSDTLKYLAAPYASHPSFDPAWVVTQ